MASPVASLVGLVGLVGTVAVVASVVLLEASMISLSRPGRGRPSGHPA
jgi:hypothetical protein